MKQRFWPFSSIFGYLIIIVSGDFQEQYIEKQYTAFKTRHGGLRKPFCFKQLSQKPCGHLVTKYTELVEAFARLIPQLSSSNPPPRPGDERLAGANKSQADEAKSTFMDELGMDKEPTRKERKKKMAKIAEDPGILVAAAGKGGAGPIS